MCFSAKPAEVKEIKKSKKEALFGNIEVIYVQLIFC